MQEILKRIYKQYFVYIVDIDQYIESLVIEIENNYNIKEIEFFKDCSTENLDLIALEYLLRKQNRNNIFSFVFLRLSALAESSPVNQDKFVNHTPLTIVGVFRFLTISVFNTIVLELKRFSLSKKLKEYPNV